MVTLSAALQKASNTPDGIITGDATNNVDIDKTLGKRYHGSSVVFKDMIGDLFGKKLLSTSGKVDYDFENNCIDFASGGSIGTANDRIGANVEINHEMMVGNSVTFSPHDHWFQKIVSTDPDVLDTTAYELTIRWRLVRNGYGIDLTTPVWSTVTITSGTDNVEDNTHANGKEYMGQSTLASSDITIDCAISDTFQFQIARTDSLGGTLKVFFFDIHGAVDSDGSDEIGTKT